LRKRVSVTISDPQGSASESLEVARVFVARVRSGSREADLDEPFPEA
jgi:hypothetical protein